MRHDEALLGAVMAEPALFELLVDDLKLPTTEGDLTVPVIASLSGNRTTVNNESDEDAEARMARLWQDYERAPGNIDCLGQLVDALEILSGWVMKRSCCDRCT